jgi:hypothetical protein
MANNQEKGNGRIWSGWAFPYSLNRWMQFYFALLLCIATFSAVTPASAIKNRHSNRTVQLGHTVAQAARAIAKHLHGVPDTSYDPGMPRAVIHHWNSACPNGSGCRIYWKQGNLQCVFLVTGAFALAGHPLPIARNAIQFWTDYAHRYGYKNIPAAHGNMPRPGDIIVWDNSKIQGGVGHVAIVVNVTHPSGQQNGLLEFAQANGPSPIDHATLQPNGTVQTWSKYTVLGYIRAL